MKRFLPVLLSLFALAIPATAGATTFGAQVSSDFSNQLRGAWSSKQVTNSLNALHKAGGKVGRADSNWRVTEPNAPVHGRHTYNWGFDDLMVSELAAARLRWEPTLAYAPRWAEAHRPRILKNKPGHPAAYLPPAHNSTFQAYATAFMKRYGPHGTFWKQNRKLPYEPVITVEVWNEPDNVYDWGPKINLQEYARMYEAVRTAIHRVNRHTRVISGGLAWTESSLPRLLRAFRGKALDAVAIHPYGGTPKQSIKVASAALGIMRRYGHGRTPVSANEYGWTSTRHTWGSTNAKHVKSYAYQALVGLAKLRLFEITPFMWGDPTWGLSTGSFARAVAKIRHHH